jgi:WD40 repeat protein
LERWIMSAGAPRPPKNEAAGDGAPLANPYVGPRALDANEPLFGRDREARELLYLLIAERIVLLHSPSGAGKTSLIQAALIQSLTQRGFRVLPQVRVNQALPIDAPRDSNRFLYSTILALEERQQPGQRLASEQLFNPDLDAYLRQRETQDSGELVIIFDQFEELLTIEPSDLQAKYDFFEQLGNALENPRVWALFAAREDYLGMFAPFNQAIPNSFKDTYRLDLFDAETARQAIIGPASAAGVEFADDAVGQLVDDLRRTVVQHIDGTIQEAGGLYVEPVQLQVVCQRLWDDVLPHHGRVITAEDVAKVGDVNKALAAYYAERVGKVAGGSEALERRIRDWFDQQLLTPDGRRNQVIMERDSSSGLANTVIDQLRDTYLVRSEQRRDNVWFELAHDRLIVPIRNDNMAWREAHLIPFQRQAALWADKGRPDNLLLQGSTLREAEAWAKVHYDELLDHERKFLEQSIKARAIQEREARSHRQRIMLLVIALVFALLLAGLGFYLYFQALHQQHIARIRELSAQALEGRIRSPQRSLLLAAEALHESQPEDESYLAVVQSLQETLAAAGGIPLVGHSSGVSVVAFNPRDGRLATGSLDGTVRLWPVDGSGHASAVLHGNTQAVRALAFSLDGRWLATGGDDNRVHLWQMDKPAPVVVELSPGHTLPVLELDFSVDSRWLVSRDANGTALLWQLDAPNQTPAQLRGPDEPPIAAVAFSPDGTWLATAGKDGIVRLRNTTALQSVVTSLGEPGASANIIAFSPDSKWLAIDNDAKVLLWRMDALQSMYAVLGGPNQAVTEIAFSPDSRWLATASLDGTAWLWRMDALQSVYAVLAGHSKPVRALTFSLDNQWLATGSDDGTARLWRVDAAQSVYTVLGGHEAPVVALAFSPNSQWLATGSDDGMARLWWVDAPGSTPIILRKHNKPVAAVTFSSDGRWLATGGYDNAARLWLVGTQVSESAVLSHEATIDTLAFSPNGKWLATGSLDGIVRMWPVAAGTTTPALSGKHDGGVVAVAFSPDGKWLATASEDGTARLWSVVTPSIPALILRASVDQPSPVRALAFTRDSGRLVTGSDDGAVRLWSVGTADARPTELAKHERRVDVIAVSIDGKWLATGSNDGTAHVLQLDDLVRAPIVLHGYAQGIPQSIDAIAFSSDNQWLAIGGFDGTARLWRLAALGADPILLHGDDKPIKDLDFSPDGSMLAIGSASGVIRLFPINAEKREAVVLSGHQDEVKAIAFGQAWLASASNDGTVRLWLAQVPDMDQLACATAGRNLSLAEWEDFLGGDADSYHKTCDQFPLHPSKYQELIANGQISAALDAYAADRSNDPTLDPPAAWLVGHAADLVDQDRPAAALATYAAARALDPNLIGANVVALNTLCGIGTPRSNPAVLDACDQGLARDPNYGNLHYNRGIVRATNGDATGAIEDFERFMDWAPGHPDADLQISRSMAWIAQLRAGHNPFSEETATPVNAP